MNISQVFMQNLPLTLAIHKTQYGFDLVPSHELMSAVEAMLESGKDEQILHERLSVVEPDYDYILLDTPPGKAMLTFNAIVAAELILVPVSAERMAIDGLADLIKYLHTVLWRRYTYRSMAALQTRSRHSHSVHHVQGRHFPLPWHCRQCPQNLSG